MESETDFVDMFWPTVSELAIPLLMAYHLTVPKVKVSSQTFADSRMYSCPLPGGVLILASVVVVFLASRCFLTFFFLGGGWILCVGFL